MSEVNLWFAKDKNNEIVRIVDIDKEHKHDEYRCPVCNGLLLSRQGKIMTWHFAHINVDDCSNEACIHFWVKNELIKIGDKFKVKINNEIKEYICKEVLIEQEHLTKEGTYKPDITIITDTDEVIYFEIANTNKKKTKYYLPMWELLKNIVVEVEVKDISEGQNIDIYKAKYWDGKTFVERTKDMKEFLRKETLKNKYDKVNIEKLNWLIDDIVKYELGDLDIDTLSDEIQVIEDKEDRKLVVELLRKKCSNVIDDYVKYYRQQIKNKFKHLDKNIDVFYKTPRIIYDRLYFNEMQITIKYKNMNNSIKIDKNKKYSIDDFKYLKNYIELNKNINKFNIENITVKLIRRYERYYLEFEYKNKIIYYTNINYKELDIEPLYNIVIYKKINYDNVIRVKNVLDNIQKKYNEKVTRKWILKNDCESILKQDYSEYGHKYTNVTLNIYRQSPKGYTELIEIVFIKFDETYEDISNKISNSIRKFIYHTEEDK